jgi:hypothetical protein
MIVLIGLIVLIVGWIVVVCPSRSRYVAPWNPMIGSLGNDSAQEEIPVYHRLPTRSEEIQSISPSNQRISDAGLKTRNYDKGLDRFIRKFDPDVEMSATMGIFRGQYSDHGWAVYA